MMLDHLGHEDAGASVVSAIEQVLGETEVRTPDLKGSANTSEVTDAILGALEKMRSEDARK
jgi:tartrate dehydrogenase/decarboxylase/D-malate dehydrogenase